MKNSRKGCVSISCKMPGDPHWIASGEGLTQSLSSRYRGMGLSHSSAVESKLSPLLNAKAPHFVRGFVTRIGFKPMTPNLEGLCSIQLSYRAEIPLQRAVRHL